MLLLFNRKEWAMAVTNLLTKPHVEAQKKEAKAFTQKHQLTRPHERLSVGDKITFWAGYNTDIRYMSEIAGIDKNGDIYVIWDCFWSPIRDDNRREIKLVA